MIPKKIHHKSRLRTLSKFCPPSFPNHPPPLHSATLTAPTRTSPPPYPLIPDEENSYINPPSLPTFSCPSPHPNHPITARSHQGPLRRRGGRINCLDRIAQVPSRPFGAAWGRAHTLLPLLVRRLQTVGEADDTAVLPALGPRRACIEPIIKRLKHIV